MFLADRLCLCAEHQPNASQRVCRPPPSPSSHQDPFIPKGHNGLPPEAVIGTTTPGLHPSDPRCLLPYTNIPHNEGIQACQKALETRPSPAPPTTYLTRMIELMLKLNNFSFNEEHYLQVQGTAMGTRMAPSYANGKVRTGPPSLNTSQTTHMVEVH